MHCFLDESLVTLVEVAGPSAFLMLNAPLDYETTPELSISVTVRNTQPAHPSLCSDGNNGTYIKPLLPEV